MPQEKKSRLLTLLIYDRFRELRNYRNGNNYKIAISIKVNSLYLVTVFPKEIQYGGYIYKHTIYDRHIRQLLLLLRYYIFW